ncbi:MAG TPA: hypothetical protein VKE22_21070 [Haliangiales bacterium]|nr:hypothetical protein [Haliangiales bacterium]
MGSRPKRSSPLALRRLRDAFGPPEPPPVRDPFHVVAWESCAYLVDDGRRAEVYRALERRVGVEPAAIAAAPEAVLRAIPESGEMNLAGRADKLRRAAEIALSVGIDELRRSVRRSPVEARKILEKFPGIGDPGPALGQEAPWPSQYLRAAPPRR